MQELAGRLAALSPEAEESFRVITYFDALVADGAGLEAVVRAAAVLSGVPAVATLPGRSIRVTADGLRSRGACAPEGTGSRAAARAAAPAETGQDPERPRWPELRSGTSAVLLEREGAAQPHDELILERCLLAVVALVARTHPESTATEILLDAARSESERASAAARLRLAPGQAVTVWATAVEAPAPGGDRTAVVPDPHGPLRAWLLDPDAAAPSAQAGGATAPSPADLPDAWRDARIAARLTEPCRPIVRAEELGVLIELARSEIPGIATHPDVAALSALAPGAREALQVLSRAPSVRAAADELGVHHSSLQQRHASLTRQLGYDPRSSEGRLRYEAAHLIARLAPVRPGSGDSAG